MLQCFFFFCCFAATARFYIRIRMYYFRTLRKLQIRLLTDRIHMQKFPLLDRNLTNNTHAQPSSRVFGRNDAELRAIKSLLKFFLTSSTSTPPVTNAWTSLSSFPVDQMPCIYNVVVTNLVTTQVESNGSVNLTQIETHKQMIKLRRYAANAFAGMTMRSLVMESFGKWGGDFTIINNHFISLGAGMSHIPQAVLANYWCSRISVCLQRGVANAINTQTNRLTAQTLIVRPHSGQGESFYPGVIEDQAEAFRDGTLLAWEGGRRGAQGRRLNGVRNWRDHGCGHWVRTS